MLMCLYSFEIIISFSSLKAARTITWMIKALLEGPLFKWSQLKDPEWRHVVDAW
jgi:hypothetical protein